MASFDELVSTLRRTVTPKPFYGRKADATPEQWAAAVEYQAAAQKRWKEKNPERASAVSKKARRTYYARHKDRIQKTARKQAMRYYRENKQAVLEKLRDKYAQNPDRYKKYVAARRKTNDFRNKQKQRYKVDLEYRLKKIARVRLRSLVRGRSGWRLVGADIDHVVSHLEAMFRPGMSWENYGVAWEIDHIYPLSAANLSDELELASACNWRNIQPLFISENAAKKDRVTVKARRVFETIKMELQRATQQAKFSQE